MAEIDVNALMQGLLGNDNAQSIQQQLLGGPAPTEIGVGQTQGGQLSLGVEDIIDPAAAPAGGEVGGTIPDVPDPSGQFLSPEEFDFLLRQEPLGRQLGLQPTALQQEAITTRGVDPRQRAQDRFNELLLQEAAPTIPTARTVGELGLAGFAPGAGTAAGGLIGARLISRFFPAAVRSIGAGRAAGASAGAAFGSEVNQGLGLEADEDFNTIVAGLTPIVGAGASRVVRKLASATAPGRSVRAARSGEVLEGTVLRVGAPNVERELGAALPQLVNDRSFLPTIINQTFNDVRAPGRTIDLGETIRAWQGLNPRRQQQIVDAVANADPEAATKLRRALDTRPLPIPAGQAPGTNPNTFTGEELIRLREGLSDTRFALNTETGAKQAAARRQRRELGEALQTFDEITERDPLGFENLTGVRLTRIKRSMDTLGNHINALARPRVQGQFVGKEFNVGQLINDVTDARTALKNGDNHSLLEVARLLENPRAFKEWQASMRRIKRLATNNNIQIFSQSFGPVTRSAMLAGDVIGAKAMGEIMVSPVGRGLLENVLKINGGQMTAPILSTVLSISRAMTTGQFDQVDEEVMNLLEQAEDAVRPQVGFSARQQIPEPGSRQQPQLSAPPPSRIQFGR